MTSVDVIHIFEALIALAAVGLLLSAHMQNKISEKLQTDYPAERARLGPESRFNYAPTLWLLNGDYRSLHDPEIDRWARLVQAGVLAGGFAALMFIVLIVFAIYRLQST
jgi:hypothetical protein